MDNFHTPVMLEEVLEYLNVRPGKWYIDCNLGGGGHTKGILDKGGRIVGIDLDSDAIKKVAKDFGLKFLNNGENLEAITENLILYQTNFANLKEVVKKLKVNSISGILLDLGVSSYQLETPHRGFSFNLDAPLDMRMDPLHQAVSAADLINGLSEGELSQLFWKLGEERYAKVIAKKIIEQRSIKKIETTNELSSIILSVRHKSKGDRTHPATRVFQALRIVVNDELNSLKITLPQALNILEKNGRLVVISFHSLEDRIVKNFFREQESLGNLKILSKKPITPTDFEVNNNPRARSGKLRVIEKC